jgi:XTP/dITP diphosphohydrolase
LQIVLASNNAKKLAELDALFGTLGIRLVAQNSLGIAEAEEPHRTFIENALAKARHAAEHAGVPAIADDSGLCVDALDGAPGVISAHYADVALPVTDREAQRRAQDEANNRLLLERLAGRTDRRARFVSTLVAVRTADDPEPLVAVGRWHGVILERGVGTGGFGYDPLLFIPALARTVAQLTPQEKNVHSHRAVASRQMLLAMREGWGLG